MKKLLVVILLFFISPVYAETYTCAYSQNRESYIMKFTREKDKIFSITGSHSAFSKNKKGEAAATVESKTHIILSIFSFIGYLSRAN